MEEGMFFSAYVDGGFLDMGIEYRRRDFLVVTP